MTLIVFPLQAKIQIYRRDIEVHCVVRGLTLFSIYVRIDIIIQLVKVTNSYHKIIYTLKINIFLSASIEQNFTGFLHAKFNLY